MKFVLIGVPPEKLTDLTSAFRLRWHDVHLILGRLEGTSELVKCHAPELVVLHVNSTPQPVLPTVREIRAVSNAPVLVLQQGMTSADHEIAFLEAGADTYLPDSSAPIELIARTAALVRRSAGSSEGSAFLGGGPVLMNPRTYEVFVHGAPVRLTATEFKVLEVLVRSQNRVVPHEYLARAVWDADTDAAPLAKKYIQRVREKLGDPALIATVHGVGYRFMGAVVGGPPSSPVVSAAS